MIGNNLFDRCNIVWLNDDNYNRKVSKEESSGRHVLHWEFKVLKRGEYWKSNGSVDSC